MCLCLIMRFLRFDTASVLFFIRLHFVFHQPLLHALDLIDRKNITKLTTPSGRVLYQVSKRR